MLGAGVGADVGVLVVWWCGGRAATVVVSPWSFVFVASLPCCCRVCCFCCRFGVWVVVGFWMLLWGVGVERVGWCRRWLVMVFGGLDVVVS